MEFCSIDLKLKDFSPIIPVWTGHSQTILGHLIPSELVKENLKSHILTLNDGDQLFIEYVDRNSDYTLSIFHGLGGHGRSDYMRRSANLAAALNWNVVLVNHRLAHPKAEAKKSYHSGRGDDAAAVVEWARLRFKKNSVQVALGFSMSGSILLNLLTERFGQHQPDFAICVNAPLKLDQSSALLSKGFSIIYDVRFYLLLKKLIEKKEKINFPFLGRTVDIDRLYTAQKNGFKDSQDYYQQCSTWPYLSRIKTKTFVLTAMDDPFVDFENYTTAIWPHSVHRTYLSSGGHMGYICKIKTAEYGFRWLDYYLHTVLLQIQKEVEKVHLENELKS